MEKLTPYEKEMFKRFLNYDVNQVYAPVGCPQCSGGYRGRIAIQEVLLISPDIRDAINARMPKAELRNLVYNSDVITLLQDGLYKVLAGFTTIEEIIKLTETDDEVNAETKYKVNINNQPQPVATPTQVNNQPQPVATPTQVNNQPQAVPIEANNQTNPSTTS